MEFLQYMLNRRRFLKLATLLSTFIIGLPSTKVNADATQQAVDQLPGYGVGAYGRHIYKGVSNNLYLPLVNKAQE